MTIDNDEPGGAGQWYGVPRRRGFRAGLTVLAAVVLLAVPAYATAAPNPGPSPGGLGVRVEIAPSVSPSPTASPTPTGDPSPTASPSPTGDPSPTGTPTATPSPGGGSGGNLPRTGLSLLSFLAAGVLLVGIGFGLRVLARRTAPVSE